LPTERAGRGLRLPNSELRPTAGQVRLTCLLLIHPAPFVLNGMMSPDIERCVLRPPNSHESESVGWATRCPRVQGRPIPWATSCPPYFSLYPISYIGGHTTDCPAGSRLPSVTPGRRRVVRKPSHHQPHHIQITTAAWPECQCNVLCVPGYPGRGSGMNNQCLGMLAEPERCVLRPPNSRRTGRRCRRRWSRSSGRRS